MKLQGRNQSTMEAPCCEELLFGLVETRGPRGPHPCLRDTDAEYRHNRPGIDTAN